MASSGLNRDRALDILVHQLASLFLHMNKSVNTIQTLWLCLLPLQFAQSCLDYLTQSHKPNRSHHSNRLIVSRAHSDFLKFSFSSRNNKLVVQVDKELTLSLHYLSLHCLTSLPKIYHLFQFLKLSRRSCSESLTATREPICKLLTYTLINFYITQNDFLM